MLVVVLVLDLCALLGQSVAVEHEHEHDDEDDRGGKLYPRRIFEVTGALCSALKQIELGKKLLLRPSRH